MNATSLLKLAERLESYGGDERFDFENYQNMKASNTLEVPIKIFDLSHDEAEALFVPGVGRVDTRADGSKMELEMWPPTATRHEVAARIRAFVKSKESNQ